MKFIDQSEVLIAYETNYCDYDRSLFVWIFTARQHITGHIVPNAIIGLK
jgi:hypothetical protein